MAHRLFQVVLFSILGVFAYILMYSNVTPEKINIELLKPAEQTIRATKTVVDTYKTEQEKEEVLKQVTDVYTLKKEYADNKVDLIASIFDSAIEVQQGIEADRENKKMVMKTDAQNVSILKEKLTEDVNKNIKQSVFLALVKADEEELSITKDLTVTSVNTVMSSRLLASDVENGKKQVEQELQYASLDPDLKEAAISLARSAIIQNVFFDSEKTEEQRTKAVENVEAIQILQGQVIVEEGQLVDRDIYRQLELAGFLRTNDTIYPYLGLALFIVLTFTIFYYFFQFPKRKIKEDHAKNQLLIFSIVFVFSLGVMKIFSLFDSFKYTDIAYFFPGAMAAMLIKMLLNDRLSVAMTILLGAFGAIVFNGETPGHIDYTMGLYMMFSGFTAIMILSRENFKTKVLSAGLLLSLFNVAFLFSLLFIMNGSYSKMEYLYNSIAAIVSGLGSAVLTMGLLPFFEAGFGILSSIKLLELSNPNHPLLRKILTETPGTYHHSVMVANLAESACEAIGANGLLARVGCYYHDIGKIKRPQFFIENQLTQNNPHDQLPTKTSRNIIIAHTSDGEEILRQAKLPQEIVDIAAQHHGTTLLKFFYYKALQQEEVVEEADYRYPGPKPQTKEAAIVGIADSVEAAVRSMKHPTTEKIEELVRQIIHDRIQDHQFDECDITLKELQMVKCALCESLHGIFHSRIEYPEFTKREQKVEI